MVKLIAIWAAAALVALGLGYKIMHPAPSSEAPEFTLPALQIDIENRFGDVDHLSSQDLAEMPKHTVMIFDTREAQEYSVSHIENAVRVNPSISAQVFAQQYETLAAGKTLVFYCSVGVRSSEIAQKVAQALPQAGPIYNLRGGLFGWHNEGRPLVTDGKPAISIHPYNEHWGQLISRPETIKYNDNGE